MYLLNEQINLLKLWHCKIREIHILSLWHTAVNNIVARQKCLRATDVRFIKLHIHDDVF